MSTALSGTKRKRSEGGDEAKTVSVERVTAVEKRLSASLSEINLLEELHGIFADRSKSSIKVRTAALHALRRTFTRLFHDGVMSGEGIAKKPTKSTDDKTEERKDGTAVLVSWLKGQYKAFLSSVFKAMVTERDDDDLAVAALSTFAHFCVHSCSIEAQVEAKGNLFCMDVAEILLTRLLASYSKDDLPPQYRGGASSTSSSVTPHVQAVRAAALGSSAKASLTTALEAFRARYVDDCDDFRYSSLLLLAKLCKDKRLLVLGLAKGDKESHAKLVDAEKHALSISGSGSASALLALCPTPVFLRACVQLLLDVSLPLTEEEWEAAEHESMLEDQWAPLLPADVSTSIFGSGAFSQEDGEDEDDKDNGQSGKGKGTSRAKLYQMDSSDEDDDDSEEEQKAKKKANDLKRRRIESERDRLDAQTSSFGDGVILPSAASAGAASFRRKGGKKAMATTTVAASATPARADDDDDGDGLDLDAIRLPGPGGDDSAAANKEAQEKADAERRKREAPKHTQLYYQRKAYSEAWLSVLMLASASAASALPASSTSVTSMGLPSDVLRRVLLALPTRVFPHMKAVSSSGKQPLLLADFLTACLDDAHVDGADGGGVVPVLALESLFYLMQNHGLEYPRFYQRLYSLLRPEAVHAKYRSHLFRSLDLFLSSSALPAYLAASFAKRALRLALTSSVPYALFALPFAYNALKRHPAAAAPLLHKEAGAGAVAGAWPKQADPFDPLNDEPSSSKALVSSLWELSALTTHSYPPVAYLARDFMKACAAGPETFSAKAEYDIAGEYSANVYRELITSEVSRTTRKGGVEAPVAVPFAFVKQEEWQGSGRLALVSVKSNAKEADAFDEVCDW